jgi:hypothetical protein
MDRFLCGEACFYRGMFVQRRTYHGDYACPRGKANVLVGDEMDSTTRVPAARGVWVSTTLSYHARHSMLLPFMGPALLAFSDAESPRVRLLGPRVRSLLGYEEGQ